MYRGISKFIIVAAVSCGLVACASSNLLERQLQDDGAKRLGAEQVRQHLAGKTQRWENGGAYFRPDGVVFVKFGGKLYPERLWSVDDDGRVCISFRDGFKTSCSVYYRYRGDIWVVTLEVFGTPIGPERPYQARRDGSVDVADKSIHGGPDEVVVGNRLDDL